MEQDQNLKSELPGGNPFEITLENKYYSPKEITEGELNLIITNIEFAEKVKLYWTNSSTGEKGYTEITHHIYNEVFR